MTHDNQFGFKKKHSTDLCIYTLKNVIEYYRKQRSPVFACFLDASKAFDRVNHWTLFRKLKDANVPIIIVRILLFWYREQEICIKWGKVLSECFKVTNGVRQGSLLSPKLFAVYVNDLSDILIQSKIGCFIEDTCFNHLYYADDLCLLAPSAIALQRLLNVCSVYGIEHDIKYNSAKSACLIFKPHYYKLCSPRVYLDNEVIAYVSTINYLGITLDTKLQDNEEMLKQVRKLYIRANVFLRKFTACSDDIKLQLFQSYCTNVYCAHLWGDYNLYVYKKVKVAYNNAFRSLFKCARRSSASQMLVTNNVLTFDCLLRKYVYDFRERTKTSCNSLVSTLV